MAGTSQDSRRYICHPGAPARRSDRRRKNAFHGTRVSQISYLRQRGVVETRAPDRRRTTPVESRHGASGLRMKPSCSKHRPIVAETCGILVHPQNVLADVAIECRGGCHGATHGMPRYPPRRHGILSHAIGCRRDAIVCHGWYHGHPTQNSNTRFHPHTIPWCGRGFHGTPWGVPWHATGGPMAIPAATPTGLYCHTTECHGNPHGTPMLTTPRLGFMLEFHCMPWRSVEGSVVCREIRRSRFCRRL